MHRQMDSDGAATTKRPRSPLLCCCASGPRSIARYGSRFLNVWLSQSQGLISLLPVHDLFLESLILIVCRFLTSTHLSFVFFFSPIGIHGRGTSFFTSRDVVTPVNDEQPSPRLPTPKLPASHVRAFGPAHNVVNTNIDIRSSSRALASGTPATASFFSFKLKLAKVLRAAREPNALHFHCACSVQQACIPRKLSALGRLANHAAIPRPAATIAANQRTELQPPKYNVGLLPDYMPTSGACEYWSRPSRPLALQLHCSS